MNGKRILITKVFCIIILIVFGLFVINNKYTNTVGLEIKESLVTKQIEIEKTFVSNGYTLENPNIILDPYDIAPLTALIIFETEKEETPTITVQGKDKWSTIEINGKPSKQHFIPVYGLYANYENEVIIKVGEKQNVIKIKTNALPDDIALPTEIKADKNLLSNQFYFVTPASKGYTTAYDVNGDIRWYLTEKLIWDISTLKNGNLLLSTERPINPPYYTTGLYEIDFLGKIYNEFSLPGGYHHDFYELTNGNLLIASDEFDNEYGTVEDIIVEVDRQTGDILKTWDLKNVLNMEDGKSENWIEYDWFHNNSVWYDEKTNSIILSGRHQDAVIAIDYTTSELKWIIGDPTTWSEEYQKYFFTPVDTNGNVIEKQDRDKFDWQWSQHAAMVTPEGYIFILDNGNNKSKVKEEYVPAEESYTRGVMYDIDINNMTVKQVWQYGKERGHEFYSPYISDVDYIDKNHYIIHSGGIVYVDGKISNRPAGFDKNAEMYSTTVETLNNKVIFEMTLPSNFYRVEKMSFANNYKLSKPNRLGTLGETKKTKTLGTPINFQDIDEIYKKHEINFTKEEDRLILNGKFIKNESVELILYKNFAMYNYPVRISKKPYTALCVDIFTQNETNNILEIDKYINKEGLSGNYSIYLKIGNKKYNTNKIVKF